MVVTDNHAISMNGHQCRNYVCSRYFLSFVLLPIHLLAHLNFLASNLRNRHATRLGRSHSCNTSHCGYTLTMLGVLGLSIPTQEYDLERAICTQGHPHARVSSKFLFFILYTHCHLHIASTISFSKLFIYLFLLFVYTLSCLQACRMQHIRTLHPPSASVSSFVVLLFCFVYTHPCLTHTRTHAHLPSLYTRILANIEVHSHHNVSPYLS